MADEDNRVRSGISGGGGAYLFFMFISFILAYFVYGRNFDAGLGFVGWYFITSLIMAIGLVPFAGAVLWFVIIIFTTENLMAFFTIFPTWLTSLTIVFFSIIVIIINLFVSLWIFLVVYEWNTGIEFEFELKRLKRKKIIIKKF